MGGHKHNARNPPSRSTVMVPPPQGQASLMVAVRVRPLLEVEKAKQERRDILRVMNKKVVLVLDPDESKDYLDKMANRTKERQYTFDLAFDAKARNREIYDGTIDGLVIGVMNGMNGTVFAYGATGSGKTYTMVGSSGDPGLMVLSLERIFRDKADKYAHEHFEVTCSYLEVYNEVIYDLLVVNSGALELREDPQQGVQVAGLKRIKVQTAQQIMSLLEEGNRRRKTESTDANNASSRSHAVLEIIVRRMPKNHYHMKQLCGKLSLVDLAGSERAAETNNHGHKLRDGANINKSLLALANCINALGKQTKGRKYVPYRNSKLTRLLKDGLSGNSKTAMITTVAAASDQYHHSINTLKYANRAKEIKTHIIQNVGTVESHVADYQKIINNLQAEVQDLRSQLTDKPASQSATPDNDPLSWIDNLAAEINENVEERINLQKALFELEDLNVCNKFELKHLDGYLASESLPPEKEAEVRERRQNTWESIRENEEAGLKYRADIEANEQARRSIQGRIDDRMGEPQTASFLKILSTFRLQAVRLQELQFQMAVRDQIISEQRTALSNLWTAAEAAGLNRDMILEIGEQKGIFMEGILPEGDGPPTVGASQLTSIISADKRDGIGLVKKQTIAGERAKYRYCFWSKYDASTTTEIDDDGPQARPQTANSALDADPPTKYQDEVHSQSGPSETNWDASIKRGQASKLVTSPNEASLDIDAGGVPGLCRANGASAWKTPSRQPLPTNPNASFQRRFRASDGDETIEANFSRRDQEDDLFVLEGAGLVVNKSCKRKEVVGAPPDVNLKLRKVRGRRNHEAMAPIACDENPDCVPSSDIPLQVCSHPLRLPYGNRRHSDTGVGQGAIDNSDRQRERRRAKLSLLKRLVKRDTSN